jgi:hypothetical protein
MTPKAVPTWLPQSSSALSAKVATVRRTTAGAATANGKTMTHEMLT